MADEALKDKYFIELFKKAEHIYFDRLLQNNINTQLLNDEYNDLLTFADILSLSSSSLYKNYALKIVSCLKFLYENDAKYKYFSRGIMIRLGNFPGYNLLSSSIQNDYFPLPLDLRIEKSCKEEINRDCYSDKIFTDAQCEIFENMLDKNHFSFSGPTSFGKSFILTSFIKTLIKNNNRGLNIAFLVPTRALVSQTLKKFKNVISDIDGYYLSSNPDIPALFRNQRSHYIFIFTPERLLHYFTVADNPSIEYVFVDEAQKILSDDTRSVVYYHAISLAERKSCKLFFSSPNVGNVDIFLKLFNKTSSETKSITESPVCQSRIFIDMIDKSISLFSDLGIISYVPFDLPTSLPDLIKHISSNVDSVNSKSLVYCNTIEDTINCAKQMSNILRPCDSIALKEASSEIAKFIHKDYYLVDLVLRGIGFHFGKLPQKIRDIVERLYEEGELHYLFCTSTLLEGVNLPAQNIFILNNQIGNKNLKSIDFWNLAGRAGRLAKELCGNVVCIRWINKEGRWNSAESRRIIENRKLESIDTDILTGKSKFYRNVLLAAQGKPFTRKKISESQRRVYNAFSNVLISHFIDDHPSLLRNEFQKNELEGTKIITEIKKKISVPSSICCRFPLIKIQYQDYIWNTSSMITPKLDDPTYDNCLNMLEQLYELYNWKDEESGGRFPLLPKGEKNTLKHFAALMTDWMNSKSISEIIYKVLKNRHGKLISDGYNGEGINLVPFNSENKIHINIVINQTISEIETAIRYTFKS